MPTSPAPPPTAGVLLRIAAIPAKHRKNVPMNSARGALMGFMVVGSPMVMWRYRGSNRVRLRRFWALAAMALLLFFILPSVVQFYTDWLWFGEVGYQSVFLRTLNAEGVVFAAA